MEEKLLSYFDFDDLDRFLNTILYRDSVSADDLIGELMTGNFSSFADLLSEYVGDALFGGLEQCRNLFLGMMLLGIFAILLNSVSDLFSDSRITLFSGYFILLFGSLLILKLFADSYETAQGLLEETEQFIGVLMPVFCIAIGMSNGTITAAAYYELQLFLLFLVQRVLIGILLPLVQVFCMLHVVNRLSEGNRFSGLLNLMKKVIVAATRAGLFASIGGSVLQAALLPSVDGMKSRLLIKTISVFPGLGDYADAIGEIVIQGAGLIKNCIGLVGVFALLILCVKPVVQTALYGCVIRAASALLQISGEKKFTEHIWKIADSFFLLARLQLFGGGIFFLSAIVATLALDGR